MVKALELQLTVVSLNPCDMAIFRFFKMTAAAILDFLTYKFLTVRRVKSVELRHRAKFRGDRSNRCHDMRF